MTVRIRMKKLGRRHRPYFRICAVDKRAPRDGRTLEELGTYDPMIADVDARAVLNSERINYWLSVGAQPSDKVKVLIKKYGEKGTRLAEQKAALERLAEQRRRPEPQQIQPPEEPAAEAAVEAAIVAEAAADEAVAEEEAPAEEKEKSE